MQDYFKFVEPLSLVWKIDNFCCRINERSPEFTYEGKKFRLVLKANVKKYFDEDTYNIYMEAVLQSTEKWQAIEVSSCLISPCGQKCFASEQNVDVSVVNGHEPIWSMDRRVLLDNYDEMKTIDKDYERITFESSLKEVQRKISKTEESPAKESKPDQNSNYENFNDETPDCEKFGNIEPKLILDIEVETGKVDVNYRNCHPDRAVPDFQIKCGKSTFHVHRRILSDNCKKFADVVLKEDSNVFEISGINSDVLKNFLKYAYSGDIRQMTEDVVPELHCLGFKYSIKDLINKCAQYWHDHDMSLSNTCELLRSAFDNHDEIACSLISYVQNHKQYMLFLDLSTITDKHRDLLYQIYRDYINKRSRLFKF